jgi:hypothetical protein
MSNRNLHPISGRLYWNLARCQLPTIFFVNLTFETDRFVVVPR